MAFVRPAFSRSQVRRAGEILRDDAASTDQIELATDVLTNWRAAHGYPLNTFQATLREKLKQIDDADAIVGQRLKRAPSIVTKLKRFESMQLNRMQDIAGLRAVVSSMPKLRKLYKNYEESRFAHRIARVDDYVDSPKADGYRSIHLVYAYRNARAPEYDNLHVELQLRTKLQHAWATAVETVDAFLGETIKIGKPGAAWAVFFKLASAAFSYVEKSPVLEEFSNLKPAQLLRELRGSERDLGVLLRLRGFAVAADKITRIGKSTASYHLVVLNLERRTLSIKSFALAEQEAANQAYAEQEERAAKGEPIDPVLVTGGTVDSLRKSYPNYFLDTRVFVQRMERILSQSFIIRQD